MVACRDWSEINGRKRFTQIIDCRRGSDSARHACGRRGTGGEIARNLRGRWSPGPAHDFREWRGLVADSDRKRRRVFSRGRVWERAPCGGGNVWRTEYFLVEC